MAIDSETARLFIACTKAGIPLGKLLMLGRQNYLLRPSETRALFSEYGLSPNARLLEPTNGSNPPFAEPFFESLGASSCDSVDVAAYEGATILHDFNEPISAQYYEKFDVVFDGGTLEHVFHFPTAILNAMQVLKRGGWYVGFTPGNNWFGHGFYQFSPELFYRALSPQNGFSSCAVFLIPEALGLPWYLVKDPAQLRNRTNLINAVRTPLLVLAKKSGPTPPKLRLQQSDYQAFWDKNAPVLNTGKVREDGGLVRSLKEKLYETMPGFTRRLATLEARPWTGEYSVKKSGVFQPLNKAELPSLIAKLSQTK